MNEIEFVFSNRSLNFTNPLGFDCYSLLSDLILQGVVSKEEISDLIMIKERSFS